MFAKLVGEGYEKPDGEAELAIDVNYSKVGEWLVDRKLIPQDWARRLQAIQAKVAEAAQDLPPGFLGQFDDNPIDYFRAKEILAKLTETAERGMLGSLKGSAGTWDKIIKAYEASLLHIAEAGLTMARNVDYDIPYFKKQAAKNQQLMADLDKKAAESIKNAAAAAIDFEEYCAAMGIHYTPSKNYNNNNNNNNENLKNISSALRISLLKTTLELPHVINKSVESLKQPIISDAVTYYSSYASIPTSSECSTQSGTIAPSTDDGENASTAVLHTLVEVLQGKTRPPSTEMLLGNALLESERHPQDEQSYASSYDLTLEDESATVNDNATGAISWDFETEKIGETEEESSSTVQQDSTHVETGTGEGISWDIDIDGIGEDTIDPVEEDSVRDISGTTMIPDTKIESDGDSISTEVSCIISDIDYRTKLLDDIYELKAFLVQRKRELAHQDSNVLLAPHQTGDAPDVHAMCAAVEKALDGLTEGRVVQMLTLIMSSAYRERLVSKLVQRASQERKYIKAAAEATSRKNEAQRQLVIDSAKLATLTRKTREVKNGVEVGLSGKLKRKIHVQGEINSLLSQTN